MGGRTVIPVSGSRYDNGMWPANNIHKYSDEKTACALEETAQESEKVHHQFREVTAEDPS